MIDILTILRKGTNFVSTVDGDTPKLRPFGPAIEHDDKIYLFTANDKSVYRQIMKNPKIEVVAMIDEGKWARISAEAIPTTDPKIVEAFLEDDPELKELYPTGDNRPTPLELTKVKATVHDGDNQIDSTE
jgi:uncharacterized pyridoxamine 5'-phosphate oxidase family protein